MRRTTIERETGGVVERLHEARRRISRLARIYLAGEQEVALAVACRPIVWIRRAERALLLVRIWLFDPVVWAAFAENFDHDQSFPGPKTLIAGGAPRWQPH